jgi:hypothetical protein
MAIFALPGEGVMLSSGGGKSWDNVQSVGAHCRLGLFMGLSEPVAD